MGTKYHIHSMLNFKKPHTIFFIKNFKLNQLYLQHLESTELYTIKV